ncbi:MAG: hypothetical protein IJ769_13350 [Clostridia bacterium]|nr:hypothetical protein [Clostridia bacterium]
MNLEAVALWLGRLLMAGFAALVLLELPRYFKTALAEPIERRDAERERLPWKRLLGEVLIAYAASRFLVALACGASYAVQNQTLEGFFSAFADKLRPWDADHYLGIIENWYVTEGDPRLHIVFLPFYPALCRALRWATGMSAFAAAEVVSNAALIGCGMAMYRLVEADGDAAIARRAMLLTLFSPMTYFYSIPYTESVFLLVTLLAVLCARGRRWALSVLFGAMAANTRIVGMAVAIPIFWEMLRADREAAQARGLADSPRTVARRLALCALRVLPVSAGLLLYMCGNYRLYGNPTQFLIFQREHWSQSFGSMANTFRYSLCNAVSYDDPLYQLGVWAPQALLLIAVPLALVWRRRREPAPDIAYLLVFHYVSFAPTWLLSGPRYLSAAYAVYPLLARIPKGKRGFAALLAGECALLAYMTVIGLWYGKVY